MIASAPFVLTAYPGLGVTTAQEFIALAKSKSQMLTFGGTAVGTIGHLVAQLFNQRAGTNLPIASYPSSAQATTDLMTGRISVAFASASNVIQLIEEKKLTALAVAQPQRAAIVPQVPSIDEAGMPGVHASIWIGLLAPAGTPRPLITALAKSVREAVRSEDFARQIKLQGMEILNAGPEDFALRIKSDIARWNAVLRATGLGK